MNNPLEYSMECACAEYRRNGYDAVWFQDGSGMFRFFAGRPTDKESAEIARAASLGELVQKAQTHIRKQAKS